ncbi:unnamed protein product [Phytophthora fragariaefolia]|uniref:Unnamed protein product n=1 Tax=Phytophthora fragariaefolia TaxID=1490495 RepID=A0A9W6XFQ0_9STRA|nr:unnamed protein product [Phytophthora fragariaefolia]
MATLGARLTFVPSTAASHAQHEPLGLLRLQRPKFLKQLARSEPAARDETHPSANCLRFLLKRVGVCGLSTAKPPGRFRADLSPEQQASSETLRVCGSMPLWSSTALVTCDAQLDDRKCTVERQRRPASAGSTTLRPTPFWDVQAA